MLGRFEEAFAESTEAERIYSDLGLRFAVAGLLQVTGPVALLAGDPEAAEHVLRRSYEILAGIGAKGYTAALLAAALYAQERYQEAAEFVAIAKDPGTHETTTGVRWRAVEAKLRALDGDVDAAVTTAREAASLASKTDALNLHAEALVALAEVLQLAGRDAEAAHAAEQAYAVYAAKGNVAAQEQMRALVAHGERR
jgi:tetratricopeptide (TPR) repeat protein